MMMVVSRRVRGGGSCSRQSRLDKLSAWRGGGGGGKPSCWSSPPSRLLSMAALISEISEAALLEMALSKLVWSEHGVSSSFSSGPTFLSNRLSYSRSLG